MSNFPSAIDTAATLYSPVNAFSTKPLETTTTSAVGAGDSTISVQSTAGGFADAYGVLSIDDELVIYTARGGSQFTGCQRGAFGTTVASHSSGATVRANMVAGFITAIQSAVLAIENELGTAAAVNYVRKDGAVTITGVKTFQDGAEFGSGNKASTGLVRLPNTGALKWRKADNSGDLGMALNASDHIAMDAIIDFAPGQTFGAFSYPDATTTSKGIVQIDPTGGLAVAAGVLSVASSGVAPGTYTKLTVDAKGRATAATTLSAADLPAHTHVAGDIVSGAFGVPRGGTGLTTIAANKLLYSPAQDTLAELSIGSGLSLAFGILSLGGHSHAESDVTGLVSDLAARPLKGLGFTPSRAAVINSSGAIEGAFGNGGDCVLVDGTSAAKANASHTHAATDIVSATLTLARGGTGVDLSACGPGFLRQDAVGNAVTVGAIGLADLPTQLQQYGPFQTIGGDIENMLKRSEDFSAIWSTDGGSCSVAANIADTLAPDVNQTADKLTSNGDSAKIQQQISGLTDGGTYTFYIWAKVATGMRRVSLAIVDNAYAGYLAGPAQVTLTTSWQRFKIAGTLAAGQTSLWVVVRNFAANGDEWTNGNAIYLWGACLQEGSDPKRTYVRTWDSQAPRNRSGAALGATIISAANKTEAPLTIHGPGSNLADKTVLQVTSGGELIIAGGSGNGYRLAELMSATNPSGWSGVLKVKTPAGTTLGYILLYSNP
ncbi:MAG: carbohydrate binding domain-containing protein [Acidobacteria bacterium]|nr:carbohydrate binding domain-containing protein [Acidobacteriota bacterium]